MPVSVLPKNAKSSSTNGLLKVGAASCEHLPLEPGLPVGKRDLVEDLAMRLEVVGLADDHVIDRLASPLAPNQASQSTPGE